MAVDAIRRIVSSLAGLLAVACFGWLFACGTEAVIEAIIRATLDEHIWANPETLLLAAFELQMTAPGVHRAVVLVSGLGGLLIVGVNTIIAAAVIRLLHSACRPQEFLASVGQFASGMLAQRVYLGAIQVPLMYGMYSLLHAFHHGYALAAGPLFIGCLALGFCGVIHDYSRVELVLRQARRHHPSTVLVGLRSAAQTPRVALIALGLQLSSWCVAALGVGITWFELNHPAVGLISLASGALMWLLGTLRMSLVVSACQN